MPEVTDKGVGSGVVPAQRTPDVCSWPYADRRRTIRPTTPHPVRRASDLVEQSQRQHLGRGGASRAARRVLVQVRSEPRRWPVGVLAAVIGIELLAGFVGAVIGIVSRGAGPTAVSELFQSRWGLLLLPAVWMSCAYLNRALEPRFLGSGTEEWRRVLHAVGCLVILLTVVSYVTRSNLSRGYVLFATLAVAVVSATGRLALRAAMRRARARGRCMIPTILAGPVGAVELLAGRLRREATGGLKPVGACLPVTELTSTDEVAGLPVLGPIENLLTLARSQGIGAVAVCPSDTVQGAALRELRWRLEGSGVDFFVTPGLLEVTGPRVHVRPVGGLPMLHVDEPELAGGRHALKAIFDRVVALVSLVVLAIPLLVIAGLVRATSRGPAIYRQTRVGRNGQLFTLLKFRSMYAQADQRLAELSDRNERADGLLFKIRDDPRVTPVGRVLRRYSLDELPQLINVARGQMSLVGPRPPLPSEVERYGYGVARRLLVKPGLTGLWQVSGRSDLSWEDSIGLDLSYVENWSLLLDLSILLKTARAVLARAGAY